MGVDWDYKTVSFNNHDERDPLINIDISFNAVALYLDIAGKR